MVQVHSLNISPPLINSSCAWASDYAQLRELYQCAEIGAITTRTATLKGFNQDETHTVAFSNTSVTTVNSYGYSPHPLASYIEWVYELLTSSGAPLKPVIISVTDSDPDKLRELLSQIQSLRSRLRAVSSGHDGTSDLSRFVAIELNTSCPNIKSKPPPAYTLPLLKPLLNVLAESFYEDGTLTIGLKLPPYIYLTQFSDLVDCLAQYSRAGDKEILTIPFAFLTCTNTLGSSLLFTDQVLPRSTTPSSDVQSSFALPTGLGGLGGDAMHSLALGNVYTFSQLLASSEDAAVKDIKVIGVGGVTNPEARKRMHAAGASVVGCATLLGFKGVEGFKLLSQ